MATSAFTAPGARSHYRVMSEDDIAFIIERFADAAERAQRAGLDGVELHAGHGYMLQAFLSPLSNRRDGRVGRRRRRHARDFLVEVVRAVREAGGRLVWPIWCRIDGEEIGRRRRHHAGRRAAARPSSPRQAGVDAIHVSAYADPASGTGVHRRAPGPHEPGRYLPVRGGREGPRLRMPGDRRGAHRARGRPMRAIADGPLRLRRDGPQAPRRSRRSPNAPRRGPARRRAPLHLLVPVRRQRLPAHARSRCTVNPRMGREHRGAPPPERAAAPRDRRRGGRRPRRAGGGPCRGGARPSTSSLLEREPTRSEAASASVPALDDEVAPPASRGSATLGDGKRA